MTERKNMSELNNVENRRELAMISGNKNKSDDSCVAQISTIFLSFLSRFLFFI